MILHNVLLPASGWQKIEVRTEKTELTYFLRTRIMIRDGKTGPVERQGCFYC